MSTGELGNSEGAAFERRVGAPEQQGFARQDVDALTQRLATLDTQALLIARRDQIVCEWYAPGWHAARPRGSASLAKALVGGISLIVALGDGLLRADDFAAAFVPQWRDDPLRSRITIRHLATHTSGLADADHGVDPAHPHDGWMAHFWQREPDPFTIARDRVSLLCAPGTAYHYSNPGMAMLGYCVTAALRDSPQRDLHNLLQERVYDPIGLAAGEWSIGYGTPYPVDGLSLWATWGGGAFTARAVARLARLMLRRGNWNGRQLLVPAQVKAALTSSDLPRPDRTWDRHAPASGLCWYLNVDGVWPQIPRDAFAGAGAGHQVLLAVPSLDLIVVRLGQTLADVTTTGFWDAAYAEVLSAAVGACVAR